MRALAVTAALVLMLLAAPPAASADTDKADLSFRDTKLLIRGTAHQLRARYSVQHCWRNEFWQVGCRLRWYAAPRANPRAWVSAKATVEAYWWGWVTNLQWAPFPVKAGAARAPYSRDMR